MRDGLQLISTNSKACGAAPCVFRSWPSGSNGLAHVRLVQAGKRDMAGAPAAVHNGLAKLDDFGEARGDDLTESRLCILALQSQAALSFSFGTHATTPCE